MLGLHPLLAGTETARQGLSCSLQPINPFGGARSRSSTGRQQWKCVCRGCRTIALSVGVASRLPPPRRRCFSRGGPGEPKRPRAYTSASRSCGEKGESRRQPTPPSSAVLAGRELAVGWRAGAGATSKKKKTSRGRKPIQQGLFSRRSLSGTNSPPTSQPLSRHPLSSPHLFLEGSK